jgi:hypothetical protein
MGLWRGFRAAVKHSAEFAIRHASTATRAEPCAELPINPGMIAAENFAKRPEGLRSNAPMAT